MSGGYVQHSEEEVRQKLISRLLELGYPKSSIVLEVGLAVGRTARVRIDLAIKDPDTNQVMAIFEIKRDLKNLDRAIEQVTAYSNLLSERVQAFIYGFKDGIESTFIVNTKDGDASQVFDLPSYDSLKSVENNLEKHRKSYNQAKKNKARAWSSIVAGMASSIAVAITISMLFGLISDDKKTLNNGDLTAKIIEVESESIKLKSEIDLLHSEVKGALNSIQTISTLPNEHGWKVEAKLISAQLDNVSRKLEALEAAITEDPAKALAVPILRKDLDNAEKSIKAELIQTQAEIDRMYDQNKWFIGLMFTIALSVLGMAASSFFNRKDT